LKNSKTMNNKAAVIDSEIDYKVVYRRIKYPRLEFKTGELLLVMPLGQNHRTLIEKHKDWIHEKQFFIKNTLREAKNKKLDLKRTNDEFKELAYKAVIKFSKELGVKVNKVYFRRMNSKWGSCSSKKNLTLNTDLKFLPRKLIEYVIFHEISHLRERRHSKRFWDLISKRYKSYSKNEKDLFAYWFLLQKRDANF
jgi:predicted metal-dependent hydrolase